MSLHASILCVQNRADRYWSGVGGEFVRSVAFQKCCLAAEADYSLLMWESFDGYTVLMTVTVC